MSVSPEIAMAYADGELDARAAADVESAMAESPALRAEIERWRRQRAEVRAAYDGLLAEPVPDALVARIRSARLPGRAGQARRLSRVDVRGVLGPALRSAPELAVAAGLALALLAGATLLGRGVPRAPSSMIVADARGMRAARALDAALTGALSSDPDRDGLTVGLSFRDREGAYCRAFAVRESGGVSGIACREDGAWRVRKTVPGAPPSRGRDPADQRLRQAGGAWPEELLEAVDGEPLDAEAEAAARERGWKD